MSGKGKSFFVSFYWFWSRKYLTLRMKWIILLKKAIIRDPCELLGGVRKFDFASGWRKPKKKNGKRKTRKQNMIERKQFEISGKKATITDNRISFCLSWITDFRAKSRLYGALWEIKGLTDQLCTRQQGDDLKVK